MLMKFSLLYALSKFEVQETDKKQGFSKFLKKRKQIKIMRKRTKNFGNQSIDGDFQSFVKSRESSETDRNFKEFRQKYQEVPRSNFKTKQNVHKILENHFKTKTSRSIRILRDFRKISIDQTNA